jgi:hypothetical protein
MARLQKPSERSHVFRRPVKPMVSRPVWAFPIRSRTQKTLINRGGVTTWPIQAPSLVSSLDTNNPAERLNPLIWDRRIYFVPDGFSGFVAKLFRCKMVDLLAGRLGWTAKDDPLQRNDKDPLHRVSPFERLLEKLLIVTHIDALSRGPRLRAGKEE